MNRLLAIDTATDALSLALLLDGELRSSHQLMPRRHQQRLFAELDELCGGTPLTELALQGIVYGRGPGSFTGLRIAASAAQGLGFSLQVPVVGLSSLEVQVWSFLRRESIDYPCHVLSTIDARIGQIYSAYFHFDGDAVLSLGEALVSVPEELPPPDAASLHEQLPLLAIGSGIPLLEAAASPLALSQKWPHVVPEAQDMFAPAKAQLATGSAFDAAGAVPDYVQKRIGWKTLAEQGRGR